MPGFLGNKGPAQRKVAIKRAAARDANWKKGEEIKNSRRFGVTKPGTTIDTRPEHLKGHPFPTGGR